ncbi:hypothetical protein B9Z55_009307 [Caenorhabditis nigoni]|uniref:DUF7627 domain-containing protein n=1 Tax=Caenorhabditis nigoni TaxID=1611254 RepID=A0A2G5URR5_9PELO|nr:hypothetical protein B9Z55_009307 [Caenorhabditis nigoni]
MVALLKNPIFAAVMSDELMDASSKYIMEKDGKPIPSFLSSILCAHWPRQYFKAFDNVNPILYTVVCIIKGWILVVQEDTQRYYSKPGESKNTPEIIETPEMVNLCAVALSDLCESAQRQLWINWASLTDEIYECIKPSITHNPNLTGESKERLLDTLLQMTQWTKNQKASMKSSGVQTVSSGC